MHEAFRVEAAPDCMIAVAATHVRLIPGSYHAFRGGFFTVAP
jgi:hypothetical protein